MGGDSGCALVLLLIVRNFQCDFCRGITAKFAGLSVFSLSANMSVCLRLIAGTHDFRVIQLNPSY